MKREDLIIILFGLLLVVAMLLTVFFGGEKSRHGVGKLPDTLSGILSVSGDGLRPVFLAF